MKSMVAWRPISCEEDTQIYVLKYVGRAWPKNLVPEIFVIYSYYVKLKSLGIDIQAYSCLNSLDIKSIEIDLNRHAMSLKLKE